MVDAGDARPKFVAVAPLSGSELIAALNAISPTKNPGPAATDAASAYREFEALLASVESGAVAPLRGSALLTLYEQGGRLLRRQELPREAFWTAAELRALVDAARRHFADDPQAHTHPLLLRANSLRALVVGSFRRRAARRWAFYSTRCRTGGSQRASLTRRVSPWSALPTSCTPFWGGRTPKRKVPSLTSLLTGLSHRSTASCLSRLG